MTQQPAPTAPPGGSVRARTLFAGPADPVHGTGTRLMMASMRAVTSWQASPAHDPGSAPLYPGSFSTSSGRHQVLTTTEDEQ